MLELYLAMSKKPFRHTKFILVANMVGGFDYSVARLFTAATAGGAHVFDSAIMQDAPGKYFGAMNNINDEDDGENLGFTGGYLGSLIGFIPYYAGRTVGILLKHTFMIPAYVGHVIDVAIDLCLGTHLKNFYQGSREELLLEVEDRPLPNIAHARHRVYKGFFGRLFGIVPAYLESAINLTVLGLPTVLLDAVATLLGDIVAYARNLVQLGIYEAASFLSSGDMNIKNTYLESVLGKIYHAFEPVDLSLSGSDVSSYLSAGKRVIHLELHENGIADSPPELFFDVSSEGKFSL